MKKKAAPANLKKWARPKPIAVNLLNSPGKLYNIPEPPGIQTLGV